MTYEPIIQINNQVYGKQAQNKISEIDVRDVSGARAALESFYFAFNQKNSEVFAGIWAPTPLAQLNNPLGGIVRGADDIRALYERIFHGKADVWVELYDIAEYVSGDCAVFAGRERGSFTVGDTSVALEIRTTRVFLYLPEQGGWKQVHHHGSIDDSELLASYQAAVSNEDSVIVVATLQIKDAHIPAFEQNTSLLVQKSKQENGVALFRLHTSKDKPGLYVFYEVFRSEEARKQHFEEEHTKVWFASVRRQWVAEPQVQLLKSAP